MVWSLGRHCPRLERVGGVLHNASREVLVAFSSLIGREGLSDVEEIATNQALEIFKQLFFPQTLL